MKTVAIGSLLLGILILSPSVRLFAADITLADGRTFKDAKVVSQSALTVMIRHIGGLAQVEKRLLPESMRSAYPINPKAAEIEKERYAVAAAALKEQADQKTNTIKAKLQSREGCLITYFEPGVQWCCAIKLQNLTENPVNVWPEKILCRASDGQVFEGAWLVINGRQFGRDRAPITVPGKGVAGKVICFFEDPKLFINDVYWKQ